MTLQQFPKHPKTNSAFTDIHVDIHIYVYLYINNHRKRQASERVRPSSAHGQEERAEGAAGWGGPRSPPSLLLPPGGCAFALHIKGWDPLPARRDRGRGVTAEQPGETAEVGPISLHPSHLQLRITGLRWTSLSQHRLGAPYSQQEC